MRRFVAVFLILGGAAGGALAQSQPDPAAEAASTLEVGVRYWVSTGKTTSSHDASGVDPILGNPTSTLTYDKLGAHTAELYARKAFGERAFIKGNVGIGTIPHGEFIDQDFFVGQALFLETTSAATGKLYYGTIDIGRDMWKRGTTTYGLFVGYQRWNERVDAYGLSNTGNALFDFTSLPGSNVPTVSNEQIWDSARIGLEMKGQRGRTRFQAELALIPYAKYRNEDSHWLRQDTLGPAPNIIATGRGRGAQFEFELRRSYPEFFGLDLGVGYRYWRLDSKSGTMTFGGESFPVVDLSSERQGLMFSATKAW
jgi:hypothetical protein